MIFLLSIYKWVIKWVIPKVKSHVNNVFTWLFLVTRTGIEPMITP